MDYPSELEVIDPQTVNDSIAYNLPRNYIVDFMPSDVRLENEFGKFSSSLKLINDKVIFKRHFEVNKGIIPESKFSDFRNFINAVATADRAKIILSRGI
jgi:hypothetical protein